MNEISPEFWILAAITWTIGLLPSILIRFVIVRRPLSVSTSLVILGIQWLIMTSIWIAMEQDSTTAQGALYLLLFIAYHVLRAGSSEHEETHQEKDSFAQPQPSNQLVMRKERQASRKTNSEKSYKNRHPSDEMLDIEIHSSDRDLVCQSDLDWWNSLTSDEVMEMEATDNAFKLAAFKKLLNQGLSEQEAAKQIRLRFFTYYGRLEQRNDERFNLPEPDVSLPYVLKQRIDAALAQRKISKKDLKEASSVNAAIRLKLRNSEI